MTDNLTERLREVRHVVSLPPDDGPTTADLCHQAAERIAKLEAENARLWSALVKACDDAWTEDPAHMARRYHEEANP